MKYVLSLAFLIALLIVGCTGSYTENTFLYSYCTWTIIADEKYTIDERTRISEALDDWYSFVPKAKLRIFYGKLDDKYPIQDGIIHIHYGYLTDMDPSKSDGWTEWKTFPDSTGAEIYINIEGSVLFIDPYIGKDFTRVVFEHELGHAFGLGHVDPNMRPNDVMNPYVGPEDKITPEDVFVFYTINKYCRLTDGGIE